MSVGRLSLPLVGAALLLVPSLPADPPANLADDPLPKGAKVRFGVSRPILRTGPTIALLPGDYTTFLAPTMKGGLRRYDLGTGRPLDKKGVVGPGQVIVSADGKRAVVARTGALSVVEVATGKEILAVEPPPGVVLAGVPGASLSADGAVLAYGGQGKTRKGEVVVFHVDRKKLLAHVETDQPGAVLPTLSPDGKSFATHGPPPPPIISTTGSRTTIRIPPESARTVQVWETATGKERFKARATGMGGGASAAAFSPDGALLAISAADGVIDLWEVKAGKRLRTLLGRKGQGVRVAFSPDGKTIASVAPNYRIQRWTIDGKPLDVTPPPAELLVAPVAGLAFADNERVIAWTTAAQFAIAWEAPTGKLLSPTTNHAAAIHSIAFPAGGKAPFTAGQDGWVFRWDLQTGEFGSTVALQPDRLPGDPLVRPVVTLSADCTRAVWLNKTSEVFDLATGEGLFCVPPPSSPQAPISLGLSPDGMKLITQSRQAAGKQSGICTVWDLATRRRLAELEIPPSGNAGAPGAVLSPKGTRLVIVVVAANPQGGSMVVVTGFDLKTGKKLAEVKHPTVTGTVSLTAADETTVVIASASGRVWAVDYVAGRMEDDIEDVPERGEPPIHGPLVFSPDGKRFATGVVGRPFTTYGVRVYDWEKRKPLHTFIGHAGPVTALRFSPDGKHLASGSQDSSVLLWDLTRIPPQR